MKRIQIELLTTPDCPHTRRARAVLDRVIAQGGVAADVREVVVHDTDDAESLDFHGSPTIRVDGADVVPPPDGERAAIACRTYAQPDGTRDGVVPEAVLARVIEARRREHEAAALAMPEIGALREAPAGVMRTGFLWASRRRSLQRFATSNGLTRRFVERFVAGETLDDALDAIGAARDAGLRTTVDVLGESVASADEAAAAADQYVQTLTALADRGLDGNVSLKLTQMGLDLGAGVCRSALARVVDCARDTGAFVRIDMEDHTRTDATLAIARELHAGYRDVGVVIQSYLRRSAADVEQLNAERIRVRLCKGAYDEPSSVAFASKAEVDASYRALAERLLTDGVYPAIATHDEEIIRDVVRFVRRHGIDPSSFEFQMLYGIRRDLQRRLVAAGYTVRVYVPYGSEWYPYFMRRLAERPANVLFMLRSVAREGRGRDDATT